MFESKTALDGNLHFSCSKCIQHALNDV